MTSPKDLRKAILGAGLARANTGTAQSVPKNMDAPLRVGSGAVGAVSRSLSQFDEQLKAAQKLAASGERIVEISPAVIDVSFVRDRIEIDENAQKELVDSIREHGQQVPILIRPSPNESGRYQVAYGHRRLKACAALEIPVKAVIRQLDDSQLLIAQGQENNSRQDLSFIERALFAATLEDRGFGRDVAMAALSTDKTELSKLMSVVRVIPQEIIAAIGPAPKIGRTRWLGLADKLNTPKLPVALRSLLGEAEFLRLPSDDRFAKFFAVASAKPKRSVSVNEWQSPQLTKPVRIEKRADATVLTIKETIAPEFGSFVVEQLPSLFAAYQAKTR